MAFTRVRTIKGKQYRYREERWREGGKVRSRSTCLGAVHGYEPGGFLRPVMAPAQGIDWVGIERQELARMKADEARQAVILGELHQAYGLTLGLATPVPIEKVMVEVLGQQETQRTEENASPEVGEAEAQ